MKHKFMRNFKDGIWHGREDRVIVVDGVEHDMDEYAKEHGDQVEQLLPFMHETKVKVVAKKDGYFVAKFQELKDMKPTKPETEKERKIRELQEQLAKLTAAAGDNP